MEPFSIAHEKQQKEEFEKYNLSAWLNGIYVRDAIAASFDGKKFPYPVKPIEFNTETEPDASPQSMENHVANFREYAAALNIQKRKVLKESEGEPDAGD